MLGFSSQMHIAGRRSMTRRSRPFSPLASLAAATLAFFTLALIVAVAPAAAVTFANTAPISIPDPNCTDPDVASPYPSNLVVSGLSGTVADVNVTLNNVSHGFEEDLELMLVGPAGGSQNLVLLSDAGSGAITNANVTFDDSAAAQAPLNANFGAGTYKPTNDSELTADAFPAPAPPASANTTLASAFNGIAPNGTWQLYVIDDACDTGGSIAGGWTLNITTAAGAATTTTVTSSPNPSTTGAAVTFTASVTSTSTVNAGTVTFTEGATTLAANVAVDSSGEATFVKSDFAEGNHIVTATYNGTGAFNTSNGSVNHRVNNVTTVTGTTYCNTGAITVNALPTGTATPYPSNIAVSGAPTQVGKVTATLKNVTHQFPDDMNVLLVGPAGQNLVLVSDAGTSTTNVTATFDDAAAGQLAQNAPWGAPGSTVSSKPVDYEPVGDSDPFAAPAPAPSAATALSTFNGTNPNGTWSLYVMSDGAPDTGTIAGGWCLNFTFDTTPPTVSIVQAAGQSDPTEHSPINFTATFSEPVTGFTGADVSFTGSTSGGTKVATVTGSGTTYNVEVTGMTTSGSVVATIPAGGAFDAANNANTASAGGDNTVGWVLDTTKPTCTATVVTGPPKRVDFVAQDTGSGIASIVVRTAVNIVTPVPIPAFTVGTTAPVAWSATKDNQAQSSSIGIVVTDVAGNKSSCT